MNSKTKGNKFERDVCKRLSEWWTGGERDDVFFRTASSGGRATQRGKQGKQTKNAHGDIAATDPIGQPLIDAVTIEVKRGYNKNTIGDILDKPAKAKEQQYEKWIRELREKQKLSGSLHWLLIHKRDQRECVVWIPTGLHVDLHDFVFGMSINPDDSIAIRTSKIHEDVCCFTLEGFLSKITPESIQRLVKRSNG